MTFPAKGHAKYYDHGQGCTDQQQDQYEDEMPNVAFTSFPFYLLPRGLCFAWLTRRVTGIRTTAKIPSAVCTFHGVTATEAGTFTSEAGAHLS